MSSSIYFGEVPEWPKGTDCKSVGSAFGGSNPPLPIFLFSFRGNAGIAQLARASAFQAEGRRFESGFPLHPDFRFGKGCQLSTDAHVAQGWSTSLVRKRSSVQFRSWAYLFCVSSPKVFCGVKIIFRLNHLENSIWSRVMRDIIQLACTECKRRNYSTTKNKKLTTQRLEFKKYCRFCRKHILHKETK